MFFKKSRATKTAVEAVSPLIRTLEISGGLPSGFWQDSYVLGFLNGCIVTFATLATGGKLSSRDVGYVIMDVFNSIADGHGMEVGKRVIELQRSKNADFAKGLANADKVVSVSYGLSDYDKDPDVIRARERASKMADFTASILGPTNATSQVGGALQEMLFFEVVRQRLGEGDIHRGR